MCKRKTNQNFLQVKEASDLIKSIGAAAHGFTWTLKSSK